MKEKLEQLFELRDYYFEDPSTVDEEGLKEAVNDLELIIPDFIIDDLAKDTKLFVCPDREFEFPIVVEFSKKYIDKGIEIVYDALKEYYKYSNFYDCYTNICSLELIKLFLYVENIPIVRFFDTTDVELLNVRKLNRET